MTVPLREWGKDTADAILQTADDTDAKLIAIATRGSGALRHALFGSVALGVISKTNLPVLTVAGNPPVREGQGPYHVVVTTDGSPIREHLRRPQSSPESRADAGDRTRNHQDQGAGVRG